MNTITSLPRAALLATAWLGATLASVDAAAARVTYEVVRDRQEIVSVSQRLIGSFKFNLRGAQRFAATQTTLSTPADFDPFAQEWGRTAVSQMEYRWTNAAGLERTTVYHGMSGRVATAVFSPMNGSTAQYTIPEWRSYYGDRNPNVYAHVVMDEPTAIASVETHAPGDLPGIGRQFDAEMRGLRTLERDLLAQNLSGGGRLTVWASAEPCPVCRRAIEQFANAYDVDVSVYFLPPVGDPPIYERRIFQMTRNRLLRNFHLRVANERGKGVDAGCVR